MQCFEPCFQSAATSGVKPVRIEWSCSDWDWQNYPSSRGHFALPFAPCVSLMLDAPTASG
jgi:hypothetical protein